MFGLGISELVVIVVIAVFVLGPKNCIVYIQKFAGFFRKAIRFRREVEASIRDSIEK
jgi:Sec-independent protein translocase protein TatA